SLRVKQYSHGDQTETEMERPIGVFPPVEAVTASLPHTQTATSNPVSKLPHQNFPAATEKFRSQRYMYQMMTGTVLQYGSNRPIQMRQLGTFQGKVRPIRASDA
ncbi:hypothetical protein Ancab_008754, partial [Ancistrocladus abbreviatus]